MKLADLIARKGYLEKEIRLLDEQWLMLRKENTENRRLWRGEASLCGVPFGAPFEQYPDRLQKKWWHIREMHRLRSNPIESRGRRLTAALTKVVQQIEAESCGGSRKRAGRKLWVGTKLGFVREVIHLYKKDLAKSETKRKYKSYRDASEEIYNQHSFPRAWKWSEERCYSYVKKNI